MQTFGFTCGLGASVVLDQYFSSDFPSTTYPIMSSYIILPSFGTEGGIVFENSVGEPVYMPFLTLGYNPIAARRILTSAVVNGIPRTTTATPLAWLGSSYS